MPSRWTLIEFEIDDHDAPALARALANALEDSGGYVEFHSRDEKFVVFAGRVFRYRCGAEQPCVPHTFSALKLRVRVACTHARSGAPLELPSAAGATLDTRDGPVERVLPVVVAVADGPADRRDRPDHAPAGRLERVGPEFLPLPRGRGADRRPLRRLTIDSSPLLRRVRVRAVLALRQSRAQRTRGSGHGDSPSGLASTTR
jgi:hypothetical protein